MEPNLAQALLSFLLLTSPPELATVSFGNVPMPPAIVLYVCKTVVAGPDDQNSPFTGYENRDWDYEGSVMHCRRIELPLIDQAEMNGADPQPFNTQRCNMAIAMQGPQWDQRNKSSAYRFWRGACPVRIIGKDGRTIAWKMPECPTKDGTVICEVDTKI